MILQRDPRLNEAINRWGCYFCSILFLANKYTNCEISPEGILDTYHESVQSGWMTVKCFIDEPDAIFHFMGLQTYYYDRHDPPEYVCRNHEIEILRFQRGTWRHFVVGDGQSHVCYDPWGASQAVAEGKLMDKRVFRVMA